jgi:hypothetical protein
VTPRTIVTFMSFAATLCSAAMADDVRPAMAVRPEIGSALKDAFDLVATHNAKNCGAALAKLHEVSLTANQTAFESKAIRDLGRFVDHDCDYATHHKGQFPPQVP